MLQPFENDHKRFRAQSPDLRLSTFVHYIFGCKNAKHDPLKGYSKKAGYDEPIDKTTHLLKRIESVWFAAGYRTRSERMEVHLHHPVAPERARLLTLGLSGFEMAPQVPIVFWKANGEEVRVDYPRLISGLRELYSLYAGQLEEAPRRERKVQLATPDIFDEQVVFALKKGRFLDRYQLRLWAEQRKREKIFPIGRIEGFCDKYAEMFLAEELPGSRNLFKP